MRLDDTEREESTLNYTLDIPRRSALYMPASNERAMQKAQTISADVIIFDLEDAVSPSDKELARERLADALTSHDYAYREKIVRVNGLDSKWGLDDLRLLKNLDFDGLLLPKVEGIQQVNEALAVLDKNIPVWAMIETPLGVINVESIAAHNSLAVLVMGTNDLAKEMNVAQSSSRHEFLYAFGKVIMAAKAFQCAVLDGVYNELDNEQGLQVVCEQGQMLGFNGKTLIHPKQLLACHQAFSPSEKALNDAQSIVDAWQAKSDAGVLVVNGRLVEALHVEQAQKLLAVKTQIDSQANA